MKDNIFSTEFYSITSELEKYSECRLDKLSNDMYGIVAPTNSKLIPINIFENNIYNTEEVEHNFIVDLLNIEMLIPSNMRGKLHKYNYKLDESLEISINSAILEYINNYGFLGLITLTKNNNGKFDLINRNYKETKSNYYGNILSNVQINRYKDLKLSNSEGFREDFYILPKNIPTNEFIYAEPVYMILDAIESLHRFKKSWEFYLDKQLKPEDKFNSLFDEPLKDIETWGEYFSTFGYNKYNVFENTTNYKIGLEFNKHINMSYTCKSLIDLIRLYLILDIVFKDQAISFCKTCDKMFIKTNPKKEYCSDTCRSYYNVNKIRGKRNVKK
ncbi:MULTISPECIES: hypothetical protein [unclassified Clostridium]|uniref:hypothetical protein n=1 Tax=unclassified Clostridium TaxID=2614128 RepID=UPI000297A804|nr:MULTISPECIES: hypothetical protein [unclassified Clostridium]EKQ57254.1 MAG: hypothetical protein A370_01071 [Clostridium sp. Maddingley MBC34-26]